MTSVPANLQVVVQDLTGDGNDDIYVSYTLGMHEGGEVYRSSDTRGWLSTSFDGVAAVEYLSLSDSGKLTSEFTPCVPSCAEGAAINVVYHWDGSQFVGQMTDDQDRPIQIIETRKCATYSENGYEPLKLCDRGPSVRLLQEALNASGLLFYQGSNGPQIDGYFGDDTATSIRLYQYQNALPITGTAEGQWYRDLIENYNLTTGGG